MDAKVLGFESIKALYQEDPKLGEAYREHGKGLFTKFYLHDGFLFKDRRLCIPQSSIRELLLKEAHGGGLMGHFAAAKTLVILREHFYWPRMKKMVERFCAQCLTCKRAKSRPQPYGLYMPLPIPTHPWVDLSMDFVVGLPTVEHKDAIMVVVDRFSKMAHFVPCTKHHDATQTADLFFKEIVRLHGVPRSIVSDREPRFLAHFWKVIWQRLGTKLLYSTSCHPQTDGQTEVVNRSLGSLLRISLGNNANTWVKCLPFIEFAYNRSSHSATKSSPFEVVYGFNPLTPLDLLPLPPGPEQSLQGEEKAAFIKKLHETVRAKLVKKTERYAHQANKHRRQMVFKPGDWVWLHFRQERFPKDRKDKLSPRGDGPFQVLEKINDNAYKIDLPGEYQVSSTFNVADLLPFDVGDDQVLRAKPLQEGGDDRAPSTDMPETVPPGEPPLPADDPNLPVALTIPSVSIGKDSQKVNKARREGYNLLVQRLLTSHRTLIDPPEVFTVHTNDADQAPARTNPWLRVQSVFLIERH